MNGLCYIASFWTIVPVYCIFTWGLTGPLVNAYLEHGKGIMPDEMFFSDDSLSLKRGKRVAARTETCRPCLVWPGDAPDMQFQGVIIDMNPYGLLVRMIDNIAVGTEIFVQLMRDEEFTTPLSGPVQGEVVRATMAPGGFTDHGVRLFQKDIERPESRPVEIERRPTVSRPRAKMHTIDFTVGQREKRSEK